MHSRATPPGGSNPFATRFVRPGSLSFEFIANESARELVGRLASQDWQGAIVGAHGSGKSTLLAALLPELHAQGQTALVYRLRDGERRLKPAAAQEAARLQATLLVVDGFEQLNAWARWRLTRLCRRRRWGLLVTSHRKTQVPTLVCVQPTLEVVTRVVARLLGGCLTPEWRAALDLSFAERQGNVREVLFDLYDLYELQRSRQTT